MIFFFTFYNESKFKIKKNFWVGGGDGGQGGGA